MKSRHFFVELVQERLIPIETANELVVFPLLFQPTHCWVSSFYSHAHRLSRLHLYRSRDNILA